MADLGWREALPRDPHLRDGLNVWKGKVTCEPVAEALGYAHTPVENALDL